MSVFTRRAAVVLATSAALTLTVVSGALAAGTTIRKGSATADPYSGNVRGTLISATVSLHGSNGLSISCNRSSIDGSVNSDGTNLTVSAMSFSDSSRSDGRCPNSLGSSTSVTAVALPYTGGDVSYGPVAGGEDGSMTINGLVIRTETPILFGSEICYYSGANGSVSGPVFNPDNRNRPVGSVAEAQYYANGLQANLINNGQYSSSGTCSTSGTIDGVYKMLGETTPGTYAQTLYLTP